MTKKFIVDRYGRVFPFEPRKKYRGKHVWTAACIQALVEAGDSGKQFLKECEQGASQFARELTNIKSKKTKR